MPGAQSLWDTYMQAAAVAQRKASYLEEVRMAGGSPQMGLYYREYAAAADAAGQAYDAWLASQGYPVP